MRIKHTVFFGIVVSMFLGFATPASALDAFLMIGDRKPYVKGGSTHQVYKDWIDVLSFKWGHENVRGGAGARGGAGVQFQALQIEKWFDSASPFLAAAVAKGDRFPRAVLHIMREGQNSPPIATIELIDVTVVSYDATGTSSQHATAPLEQVQLRFSQIFWYSLAPGATGSKPAIIRRGWDLNKNQGLK